MIWLHQPRYEAAEPAAWIAGSYAGAKRLARLAARKLVEPARKAAESGHNNTAAPVCTFVMMMVLSVKLSKLEKPDFDS